MTAREEQETAVTYGRDDEVVRVWTTNRSDLLHLRKLVSTRDFVTEVRGGTDWGEFEVQRENFRLLSAVRAKRKLSEATKAARAEHLRSLRAEVTP